MYNDKTNSMVNAGHYQENVFKSICASVVFSTDSLKTVIQQQYPGVTFVVLATAAASTITYPVDPSTNTTTTTTTARSTVATEEDNGVEGWVIAVAVVCSIIAVGIIVAVVIVIIKAKR